MRATFSVHYINYFMKALTMNWVGAHGIYILYRLLKLIPFFQKSIFFKIKLVSNVRKISGMIKSSSAWFNTPPNNLPPFLKDIFERNLYDRDWSSPYCLSRDKWTVEFHRQGIIINDFMNWGNSKISQLNFQFY